MTEAGGVPARFGDLWAADRARQNAAFDAFMDETGQPVPWAHEVWGEVVAQLGHADNHNRAVAAQLLCNLAAGDPSERIVDDLPALIEVTRDPRFVTARHCLLSLWRIGLAGPVERAAVVAALEGRYRDCAAEKNATLIRNDIVASLRRLCDATGDAGIESTARRLIDLETDPKYRRKYLGHWKPDRAGAARAAQS
ncbi:hypothetical protein [Catellatospora sichuanensis]|uniref:hypothetical protein n=1 Tax=Catellatospora sichuanensis TaxID=1969805 RepID=UPI0011821FDF|nr:hypothetical protein [Catellatospora sichuanensis]